MFSTTTIIALVTFAVSILATSNNKDFVTAKIEAKLEELKK